MEGVICHNNNHYNAICEDKNVSSGDNADITPPLYYLARQLIWPSVMLRAASHPHEIAWKDPKSGGSTVLHQTCRIPGLSHVVQSLLLNHTNHNQNKNNYAAMAAKTQDERGWTPLHVSCWNGASFDIVLGLIRIAPGAAFVRDEDGRTPLHVLCDSCPRIDMSVLKLVLETNLRAALCRDYKGCTPLALLCERRRDHLVAAVALLEDSRRNSSGVNDVVNVNVIFLRLVGFRKCWEQMMLLLQARQMWKNNSGGNGDLQQPQLPFSILHAVAGMGNDCPLLLAKVILLLHHEQVYERNMLGRLPLHEAAASISFSMPATSSSSENEEDANTYLIRIMISLYPTSPHIHDERGRFPLTLGLASGKFWTCKGHINYANIIGKNVCSNSSSSIQRLFTSAPMALSARDPVTRLYPFMIAAIATMDGNSIRSEEDCIDVDMDNMDEDIIEEKTEDDIERLPISFSTNNTGHDQQNEYYGYLRLSTIYIVLRADPAVLNMDAGDVICAALDKTSR